MQIYTLWKFGDGSESMNVQLQLKSDKGDQDWTHQQLWMEMIYVLSG